QPGPRTASARLWDHPARARRGRGAAALSPHLARIRHEEIARGGAAAHLAAGACVPGRGTQRDASPRILDARMVPRRCRLRDADGGLRGAAAARDRKSTRLNSSHVAISYAVFCLKKKKTT